MTSPSRLVAQRDCARVELQSVHELQVEVLRETRERRGPVASQPWLYHELLIDQPQFRQRHWKLHVPHTRSGGIIGSPVASRRTLAVLCRAMLSSSEAT